MEDIQIDDIFTDIGGVDIGELDLDFDFDFIMEDEAEESRYLRTKVGKPSHRVSLTNAAKAVEEIGEIGKGDRVDAFLSGNFIFGDFILAYLTKYNLRIERLTISTLSLSADNVDAFEWLMRNNYIGQIDLIVSHYFYGHERGALIPYIYEKLDFDNRFQFAVAFVHTKTMHFETQQGAKIVIHGSANLRSSMNVEQFTIEEHAALYDFYDEKFTALIEKYKTINKEMPRKKAWEEIFLTTKKLK